VPEGGPSSAIVMWNSGRFFGCQFQGRISPASVSAAVLQSPFEMRAEDAAPLSTYQPGPIDEGLSPTLKAWILVGLVVATWGVVFAVTEWLL
jgi:hypothetical protein